MFQSFLSAFGFYIERVPEIGLVAILVAFGVLVLKATILRDYTNRADMPVPINFRDQLANADNKAFGLLLGAFIIGQMIAMCGALTGGGNHYPSILIGGLAAAVLMPLSLKIIAQFVLTDFDDEVELFEDKNIGTAFVWAGSSIATGATIFGVLSGSSDSWIFAIRDIVIYWAFGQLMLVIGSKIFMKLAGFKVQEQISKHNNAAAGALLGGQIAMLGIVTAKGLYGAGSDFQNEIAMALALILTGTILISLMTTLLAWVLIGRKRFADEVGEQANLAIALVVAAIFIGFALVSSFATHVTTSEVAAQTETAQPLVNNAGK